MKITSLIRFAVFSFVTAFCVLNFTSRSNADVIDAVVATVDEHPILLSDLNKLLAKPITMSVAANSSEARSALDRLIFESLLTSEAEARRINVADSDVERYVDEVANRNGLNREGFVEALKAQGKDWPTYRNQVRLDILQTRLASVMLQGMSTVREEDINKYFEQHPEKLHQGATITLRRLVTMSKETAVEYVNKKLSDDEFASIAKEHSIAADASEGGLLGSVAERDLAPDIFSALIHSEPGYTSNIVEDTGVNSFTIYYVVERSSGSEADMAALREQVKHQLTQEKLAQSMEGMFQTELFKNHTIDKKI